MKPLSYITERFTESVIREMTRICDASGGCNLSQGFPDFEPPVEVWQAAIQAIRDNRNQYPVTYGEPDFREAIAAKSAAYNHLDYDPETEITVTCGATEAMIATMKALINPGDEVVIFEPFYENYGPDAILSGASPRFVTLYPPDWHFESGELKDAFNEKTKAIIINTPNNPTGKVFSRLELEEIAKICIQWNVYAVTDEIYEHILYDGTAHLSIASLPGMHDRSVTINSLSKTFSVTGWRIGWAIASEPITSRIRKVHDFLTVGAPTPFQAAGVAALNLPSCYYEDLRKRYLKSRVFVYDALQALGFQVFLPQGSYYYMAGIAPLMASIGAVDDFSFSRRLIEVAGVATVPGTSFYSSPGKGRDQVRFTFCKKEETLEKAIDQMNKVRAFHGV